MTKIILIDSGKGGIGKTTEAQNLGYGLAVQGRKVVIIDTDKQAMSSNLLDVDAIPDNQWHTLTDVIRKDVPLLDAMYQARPGLWVVPSDTNIEKASSYILVEQAVDEKALDIMVHRVEDLMKALAPAPNLLLHWQEKQEIRLRDFKPLPRITGVDVLVHPEYVDYIIFDFGGDPGILGRTIRRLAHTYSVEIWAPVGLEYMPMQGFAQMKLSVEEMFKGNPERTPPIHIVPFRVNHVRDTTTTKYLAELYFYYPTLTMRSIHDDGIVPKSQDIVPSVTVFEHSRSSRTSKELFDLALRVDGYTGQLEGNPVCEICQEIRAYAEQQRAAQRKA